VFSVRLPAAHSSAWPVPSDVNRLAWFEPSGAAAPSGATVTLPKVTQPAPPTSSGLVIRLGLDTWGDTVRVPVAVLAPWLAPITTGVAAATAFVATVNVAVRLPAGTVTVAGTLALGSALPSPTTAPPVGAGPFRVTVPVAEVPPSTGFGLKDRAATASGLTVRGAVAVVPQVADRVIDAAVATGTVLTGKMAVVAPAGTVTEAGTVAIAGALLASWTDTPAAPAGAGSVTVPTAAAPPSTLAGATDSDVTETWTSESRTELEPPPKWAVMSIWEAADTGAVVIGKVAVTAPAGTVTLAGTATKDGELLERGTARPPAGAGSTSTTDPVAESPPKTTAGLTATLFVAAGVTSM